jgi:hypothetical protein
MNVSWQQLVWYKNCKFLSCRSWEIVPREVFLMFVEKKEKVAETDKMCRTIELNFWI